MIDVWEESRIRSFEFRHHSSYVPNQPCGLFLLQKVRRRRKPLVGSTVLASTRNCETTAVEQIDICPNKRCRRTVMVLVSVLISLISHSMTPKPGVLVVLFFGQFILRALGSSIPCGLCCVSYQSWHTAHSIARQYNATDSSPSSFSSASICMAQSSRFKMPLA